MLVMMLSTVTIISSCGGDDNDNDNSYSLIGTWKYTYDTGYQLDTFYADGTYMHIEYYNGKVNYKETAKYTYENNIITISYSDGKEDIKIPIRWQNKDKFYASSDYDVTWIRQN